MKLKVLLLGSGGRESALAWKLAQSPLCGRLFAFPGNPGMENLVERVPGLDLCNHDELADWCLRREIDLVVVGPEQPLVAGIVDHLEERGIHVMGPGRLAAELEGSKAWAKAFMVRHKIPTALHQDVTTLEEARHAVDRLGPAVVVKADGLAAGKGVILPSTEEEALEAAAEMLSGDAFGEAGHCVVIEERMQGPEISVFALCDGKDALVLGTARDFKRLLDGHEGPNTGGMGALSPSPDESPELMAKIRSTILDPVLEGMNAEGRPYRGILYLGLMLTQDGPKVIEFNCRFGDPETQALLPRLDFDLLDAFQRAASAQGLGKLKVAADGRKAICLVLASEGYPDNPRKGLPLQGLEELKDSLTFHAGTRRGEGNTLLSAGGRVLNLVTLAESWEDATRMIYQDAAKVRLEGVHYRKDITP